MRIPRHASEVTKGLDVAKPIEKFLLPFLEAHLLRRLSVDVLRHRCRCAIIVAAGSA